MVRAPSEKVGERWEKTLRVTQDLGMPCPRLQFTWIREGGDEECRDWVCLYTLVLPLRDTDIRREGEDCEKVRREWHSLVGLTRSSGGSGPFRGGTVDTPFRDGAHAHWDAEVLGGLTIWAVCDRERAWIKGDR